MSAEILLCDDDVHILRAAEFKLKKAGYTVCTASDGLSAWEAIQQRVPHLLVTDYQMPRLDGMQLIARLRAHEATATMPIILLTAKGMEIDQEAMLTTFHLTAILAKPFSPREVLARVQQAVGLANAASLARAGNEVQA